MSWNDLVVAEARDRANSAGDAPGGIAQQVERRLVG
jgi:hypothetical protein